MVSQNLDVGYGWDIPVVTLETLWTPLVMTICSGCSHSKKKIFHSYVNVIQGVLLVPERWDSCVPLWSTGRCACCMLLTENTLRIGVPDDENGLLNHLQWKFLMDNLSKTVWIGSVSHEQPQAYTSAMLGYRGYREKQQLTIHLASPSLQKWRNPVRQRAWWVQILFYVRVEISCLKMVKMFMAQTRSTSGPT